MVVVLVVVLAVVEVVVLVVVEVVDGLPCLALCGSTKGVGVLAEEM